MKLTRSGQGPVLLFLIPSHPLFDYYASKALKYLHEIRYIAECAVLRDTPRVRSTPHSFPRFMIIDKDGNGADKEAPKPSREEIQNILLSYLSR